MTLQQYLDDPEIDKYAVIDLKDPLLDDEQEIVSKFQELAAKARKLSHIRIHNRDSKLPLEVWHGIFTALPLFAKVKSVTAAKYLWLSSSHSINHNFFSPTNPKRTESGKDIPIYEADWTLQDLQFLCQWSFQQTSPVDLLFIPLLPYHGNEDIYDLLSKQPNLNICFATQKPSSLEWALKLKQSIPLVYDGSYANVTLEMLEACSKLNVVQLTLPHWSEDTAMIEAIYNITTLRRLVLRQRPQDAEIEPSLYPSQGGSPQFGMTHHDYESLQLPTARAFLTHFFSFSDQHTRSLVCPFFECISHPENRGELTFKTPKGVTTLTLAEFDQLSECNMRENLLVVYSLENPDLVGSLAEKLQYHLVLRRWDPAPDQLEAWACMLNNLNVPQFTLEAPKPLRLEPLVKYWFPALERNSCIPRDRIQTPLNAYLSWNRRFDEEPTQVNLATDTLAEGDIAAMIHIAETIPVLLRMDLDEVAPAHYAPLLQHTVNKSILQFRGPWKMLNCASVVSGFINLIWAAPFAPQFINLVDIRLDFGPSHLQAACAFIQQLPAMRRLYPRESIVAITPELGAALRNCPHLIHLPRFKDIQVWCISEKYLPPRLNALQTFKYPPDIPEYEKLLELAVSLELTELREMRIPNLKCAKLVASHSHLFTQVYKIQMSAEPSEEEVELVLSHLPALTSIALGGAVDSDFAKFLEQKIEQYLQLEEITLPFQEFTGLKRNRKRNLTLLKLLQKDPNLDIIDVGITH